MSFLKKLFGAGASGASGSQAKNPAADPNLIQVYDAYGREFFITREEWRKSVLPGSIQSNWSKPDELYSIIVGAMNDGFFADVVDAAERLLQIDPQPVRSACIWGIVLTEVGRLDEGERVFRDYIARYGEDGVILTNLAKIYSRRKNDAKAGETLWRALELDPNQENGMGWYLAIHKERGGDEDALKALRRVAQVPGSWRAQLWLAREALKRGEVPGALDLYKESLAAAPTPAPTDLLMMMSADLGNAGRLAESVDLTLPLSNYLLRLEQLLAVRCAGMEVVPATFLRGGREILDGNIYLCLSNAKNPNTRILLLQTVKAMKRVQPELVAEYRTRLQMLERDHPLDEPARNACAQMLGDALS
jgi:tetratricopeptide (TPR) repeat protein